MGFTPNQQQNTHRKFSLRQTACAAKYFVDIVVIGLHIFYEVDCPEEYLESIFGLTAGTAVALAFISIASKNDQLFNLFELSAQELTISNSLFENIQVKNSENSTFHRIDHQPSISIKIRRSPSAYRKIERNHLYYSEQIRCSGFGITQSDHQLLHLLHHRHWGCRL